MRPLFLSLLLSLSVSLPCWASASRAISGGSTDRADFGDVTYFDGATSLSIAFWFYLTTDTTGRIITKWSGNGDNQVFIVMVDNSKDIGFAVGEAPSKICLVHTAGDFLTVGAWNHVMTVWSGACNMTVYVNGVSRSLTTDINTSITSLDNQAASLQIGYETNEAATPANFSIAYLGFWTSAIPQWMATSLASGEPVTHFDTPNLKMCPQILGDSPETDLCSASTGTITGTTTSALGPPVFLMTSHAWRHWFDRLLDWMVPNVFADDVILCNPIDPTVPGRVTSYQKSVDPFKSGAVSNPNSLIWSLPPSTVNPWDGIVPNAPQAYWKCSGNVVIEMSQTEKDAVDAPSIAEQARQQAFTDEISGMTGNDICHADLAVIQTKVDAWLASRQAELDAATTNAQVKASLRDQFYPAVASAFLKVMKCVRAVQR